MSEAMNLGSLINGISSFLHVTAVHAESKEVALSGWSKGDEGKSLRQNGRVLCEPGGCAREGGETNKPSNEESTDIDSHVELQGGGCQPHYFAQDWCRCAECHEEEGHQVCFC